MNLHKVFWGAILLIAGILMLLQHLDLFHIHFWYLFYFWPVVLIIWGVFLLPINNRLKLIVSAAILIITFITMLVLSENYPDFMKNRHGIYYHHDNDDQWDNPYFDTDSNSTEI